MHVRLLLSYIGDLEAKRVRDGTLRAFVADRLATSVSNTTINRSLETVRTILNRATRAYRDDDGRPWLDAIPPLLTMLPESRRPPYPITWQEQDRLFPKLPAHLGRMVLFTVNTGLRSSNVCGLEWTWEVPIPEIGRSVFVIPPESFKSNRAHVVILNDVAWSIIEAQRRKNPIWVFPYRGRRIGTMNNTAWQNARKATAKAWKEEFGQEAPRGLERVRIPRPATHVCRSFASRWGQSGGSRSLARSCESDDGGSLRQRRCGAPHHTGKSRSEAPGNLHRFTRGEWLGLWTKGPARVPQKQIGPAKLALSD
jgi:integrase